jgi:hypothetical protein
MSGHRSAQAVLGPIPCTAKTITRALARTDASSRPSAASAAT